MDKVRAITKGSQIIDQIYWELLNILKSKSVQTEISLANFIKRRAKKLGAEGMAFSPIVSFGTGSVEIHHKPSKKKIGKNNFLMLDFGVKVSQYCSDFTRTIFLGRPTQEHEKIYNIVLKSQQAAIKKISIGETGDVIDFSARHIINLSGYGKFYNHGTGHGVTKKIHDLPNFKPSSGDVIHKNDIVTVEPGIYLPKKFGIRIEDMVLVTNKPKVLSSVPTDFKSMIVK